MESHGISHSSEGMDRLFRSHGHALHDVMHLRNLDFQKQRLPDLVVWPESHDDVLVIVNECAKRDIVLIPFGGGTSVSWGVSCPLEERRMYVSLDTSQMVRRNSFYLQANGVRESNRFFALTIRTIWGTG